MEKQYKKLIINNDGVCPLSREYFGELMPYLIFGLYEESICADHHGNVKIIGYTNKKKHNFVFKDTRVSITLVRTGIVSGVTGTTIFVL